MSDTPNPDDQESTVRFIISVVASRLLTLLGLGIIVAGLAWWLGFTPEIPRPLVLGGVIIGIFLAIGRILVGPYISTILPDPDWTYLVDLEVTDPDSGALYRLPPGSLDEWEVTEYSLDNPVTGLYFAKDVDVEERTLRGTWRGEYSDRELLAAFTRIQEQRENLKEDAEVGFTLRRMMPVIVRGLVKQESRKVQQAVEEFSLPDGLTIQQAMDRLVDSTDDLDPDDLDDLDGGEHTDTDDTDLAPDTEPDPPNLTSEATGDD
ncbi:hypothetical protein [Salinirussus salinus]|uniref:hypothetical protein n=1 Tax=Salinirussus salinus TaxID=1198300 RepID=UPI00135CBCB1|nr:hypothetical protein [Salinirussus salinus]